MAPRKPRIVKPIVEENFRILVEHKIMHFLDSADETGLTFPKTLTAHERAYIHLFVTDKNIKSKSHGKGVNRQLTLYKKSNTVPIYDCIFDISEETRRDIYTLLKALPVSQREKTDLNPDNQIKRFNTKVVAPYRFSVGAFSKSFLTVPPNYQNSSLQNVRRKLPVYEHRENILHTINNNQVVVISGETGSGKTTQIPQFILEDCNLKNKKCRIICTQPRRLSAVSVAERVAAERGENLGHVIGYQIRLESRTSPSSNLIYCTNGILLRCLMGESRNDLFASMTHIIVDEVHERDKFSDFLLIALRRYIQQKPNLRIILMSATIESEIFSEYFYNCKILKIPGRLYHVQSHYLDEILPMIGYTTPQMRVILKERDDATIAKNEFMNVVENAASNTEIDKETTQLLNDTLESCIDGVEDSFSQFFYMVEGENIPVDYRHQNNAMTVLMIASYLGNNEMISVLLNLGADPYLKSCNGYNSIDIARAAGKMDCVQLLESARIGGPRQNAEDNSRNNRILEAYQITTNDDHIDYSIIYAIIKYIHTNLPTGSILVFLPGYEDIIETNELISKGIGNGDISGNLVIFMLHSNMPTSDQKSVFRSPPFGSRKIILSTNIAETSITIDDIVYVIDSGKVKQKSYDALTNSVSLAPTWISQACSTQRTGRAGRTQPGKSFNIFSKNRFDSMEKYTVPEILRIPLTEICLQTKLLTSSQTSIIDFLSEALQKPSILNINQSIILLKSIDALDRQENLTELGTHLADLPVDVQLGKILIYSVMLKCLDPILTIVSALSVKDPFILPPRMADRRSAITVMKELSEDTYSDHLAILRIFQKWLNNKSMKNDKKFCRDNYISSGVMETICGVRSQILGYLRAVGLIQSHGTGNIHSLNKNSNNWPIVKACLVAGLYPNLCRIDKENCQLKSKFDNKILIHQSSVLRDSKKNLQKNYNNLVQLPSDWIVFGEKTKFGRFNFIKQNTVVSSLTVALFCGSIYQDEATALEPFNINEDSQSEDDDENPRFAGGNEPFSKITSDWTRLVLDNWIQFTLNTETAFMIFHLRQKFNALFLKFIQNPRNYFKTENDSKVISLIAKVLLHEDKHNNFAQPERIGERPKAVILNLSSDVNFGIQDKNDYSNLSRKISEVSLNSSVSQASGSSSAGPTTSSVGSVGPYFRNNDNFNQKSSYLQNTQPSSDINKMTTNSLVQVVPTIKKYFIVKAASKDQVLGLFVTHRWDFSQSVLAHVQKLVRSNPSIEAILFFHVFHENSFVGLGKLIVSPDRYRINCLSKKIYSFGEIRKMFKHILNGDDYTFKAIDRCYDGEELPSIIGELLYKLLLDKNLDRN